MPDKKDDIFNKSIQQFDNLTTKFLEIVDSRFKQLEEPPPPKRKGKRVTPVQRTPF